LLVSASCTFEHNTNPRNLSIVERS